MPSPSRFAPFAVALALAMPFAAFAGNVTFTADTNVVVPGSAIDLVILNGSDADSVVLDTNTVTVTVSGSDQFQIQAPSGNRLENDQSLDPCGRVGGIVTLTITTAESPIVITPSATTCSPVFATSASLEDVDSTTVSVLITGDGFDTFVHNGLTIADATDLAKITYDGANPTSATILNVNTIDLRYPVSVIGTGTSGGDLTINANTIQDSSVVSNDAITVLDADITDNATPLLVSSVPTDGATGVSRTSGFSLTFSEPMDEASVEAAYSLTPASGSDGFIWNGSDTVVLVNHSTSLAASTDYTIGIAATAASSAVGDPDMSATDVNFRSASSGGGGGGGGGIDNPPPSCTVASPNGGETIPPGSAENILWTSGGSGINNVALFYSTDSGLNWHVIAAPEPNDGSYLWTVPSVETTTALVRIDCRDSGGAVLATDQSNAVFTIATASPVPPPSPPPPPPGNDTTTWDGYSPNAALANNPDIGTAMGISGPGTALCPVGRLIKSSALSTVYWCGGDGFRYDFPNEGTYFSWYADFSNIITLTPEQVASIPLGRNIIYRPGLRMLKIQSDPKVYAVARFGILRWIETEDVAKALYGNLWARYVNDVPDAFFSDYTIGRSITPADVLFGSTPPAL